MDKVLAKHLLVEAGVPTPEFFAFSELAFRELGAAEALPQIEERLEFPIVVKPAAQGSALGIKFARTADDVPAALVNAFSYDDKVLLERHIDGRELAVSMIEQDGAPLALPIVEAVPRDEDFFDFESRYEIGRTEYRCPPELTDEDAAAVAEAARATWSVLGCQGFARADIMLPAGGEPQVLEVNVTPGPDRDVAAADGVRGRRHRVRSVRRARARARARSHQRLDGLIRQPDAVVRPAVLGIDLGRVRQDQARHAGGERRHPLAVAERHDRLRGRLAEQPALLDPLARELRVDLPQARLVQVEQLLGVERRASSWPGSR